MVGYWFSSCAVLASSENHAIPGCQQIRLYDIVEKAAALGVPTNLSICGRTRVRLLEQPPFGTLEDAK